MFKSVFFSFLVRVEYEPPVDSAEDIVNRDDIYRAHFCGGHTWDKRQNWTNLVISGGTFEKFFGAATNPVHRIINEMAHNEKYG